VLGYPGKVKLSGLTFEGPLNHQVSI
jgi:hypothetical protein